MIQENERHGFSWLEAGAGRPLLFLHPVVSTSVFWRPQFDAFSSSRRCLALDAPGFSAATAGISDPHELGKRVVTFLDLLEIREADVVGLSLGGGHAMYAVALAPERFGKLVLADTSLGFGIDPTEWLANWLTPLDRGGTPASLIDSILDTIVHEPLDSNVRADLIAGAQSITDDGFRCASAVIAQHDASALIPALTHQTLVLVGEHDGETPPAYSEALTAALPFATLAVIADAGHLSSIERPEAFNQLVGTFLDG